MRHPYMDTYLHVLHIVFLYNKIKRFFLVLLTLRFIICDIESIIIYFIYYNLIRA